MATMLEVGRALQVIGTLMQLRTDVLGSEATDAYLERIAQVQADLVDAEAGLQALGLKSGEANEWCELFKSVLTTQRAEVKNASVKEGPAVKARLAELVAEKEAESVAAVVKP